MSTLIFSTIADGTMTVYNGDVDDINTIHTPDDLKDFCDANGISLLFDDNDVKMFEAAKAALDGGATEVSYYCELTLGS